MTQQEFSSYPFSSEHEPNDEMLNQLMENAARKARESNQEADTRYFDALRRDCKAAKVITSNTSDTHMKEDTIPLFLSFCIEQYKKSCGLNGQEAMKVLSESGALDYLEDNYEVIHTQSPQWILEEINEFINHSKK